MSRNTLKLPVIALLFACAPPPEESPEPPTPPPPPPPAPLWVGVVRRDAGLVPFGDGAALTPIARFDPSRTGAADAWDQPWPELFRLENVRFDRRTGAPRVMRPRWSTDADGDREMVAEESGQAGWRLTRAAPVRWHLYADGESVATLEAPHLNLGRAHCMLLWTLGLAPNTEVEALLGRTTARYGHPVGVAFSELADAILDETDIPALEKIRRELGLVDRTEEERRRPGEYSGADYEWLGFYRFGNLVVGVTNQRGYEGDGYLVVEIDGDEGRLVANVHGGGC